MARIAGVNIPTQKKLGVALTYVYGIGDKISKDVCSQANVDANTRVQDLSCLLYTSPSTRDGCRSRMTSSA